MEVEQDIAGLINDPIPGDTPCGISVKYEENFLALEAELAKQESLTAATVDWHQVEQLSRTILSNESKDLLVACYLAVALHNNKGYAGLASGIALVQGLCQQWWEDLFPPLKRIRGRTAAINWLVEKVGWLLESRPPEGDALAMVPALYQQIYELDIWLAEKMEDKAPDMSAIVRPLRQLKKSVEAEQAAKAIPEPAPSPKPESVPEPATPTPPVAASPKPVAATAIASPSAAPKTEINADVASDAEANKALRQIQDAMRKLATYYGESAPTQPRRFRLARYALWLNIDTLPPNNDGKTQVPAPSKDLGAKVQQALDQADYTGAIEQIEKQLVKLPYWFEGHRLMVMAMEQMGGSYKAALQVVITELKGLVERLPGLLELSYSDGTAFVDDATRFWLNQAVLASAQSNGQAGEQADDLTALQATAIKLAASGKVAEGVKELQDYARHCGSKRQEYRARLALAELLLDSGQASAALPILMRLSEYLEQHGLAEWEPDFARHCYQLLHLACNREVEADHPEFERLQKKQTAAYAELCWYDAGAAIN